MIFPRLFHISTQRLACRCLNAPYFSGTTCIFAWVKDASTHSLWHFHWDFYSCKTGKLEYARALSDYKKTPVRCAANLSKCFSSSHLRLLHLSWNSSKKASEFWSGRIAVKVSYLSLQALALPHLCPTLLQGDPGNQQEKLSLLKTLKKRCPLWL